MSTRTAPTSTTRAPASSPDQFRIAAIDIGSNSIHMAVAQVDADGSMTTLWRMKEMVGLGRISFPSRRLSREAIDRAITTLRRFQQAAISRKCEKIVAAATSAVREAENGGDFLERVRRELGMRVRIISARDEARMIYLGVRHAIDLGTQPRFILDIGGGSVEFIVADNQKPLLLESRKLGATRMTAKYVSEDPIGGKDLKNLLAHYDRELTPLCESILAIKPFSAIGTSGTVENLAAICNNLYGKSTQDEAGILRREHLEKLVSKLLESRSKDRAALPGLDEQRKDQVTAGALLVHELFRRLNLSELRVCKSALREGMLVDYIGRHAPELSIRRQVPDPRRRSVLDLARRCDWHQAHAEHVAKLTLELFDQTRSAHRLRAAERELIEYGALLHDIGWHISGEMHHKHSMYLILNGHLQNFSQTEVEIIANIARYHRKSEPDKRHESFARLGKQARKTVQVGAGLLRVADGLDRTHCQVVWSVKARVKRYSIDIAVNCRGDAELEIWAARRKATLLADVFARTIEIEECEK